MPDRTVVIPYSRVFPYPRDACFAWLTDYQDDDPQRTDAIVKKRPVIERTKDRVVMDGELEILGTRMKGIAEVLLFPPDRYEARITKREKRLSTYRYRLTPVAGGTRLDVEYEIVTRRFTTWFKIQLGRPFIRRELETMWRGFARSMEKDFAEAKVARVG